MVIVLGIIQFLIILLITAYEFINKSPVVFLWATLSLMFGLMHFLTSLTGDYLYSDEILTEASFFAIVFSILYVFFRVVFIKVKRISLRNIFKNRNIQISLKNETAYDTFLCIIFIFAMLVKLVPYLQFVGDIFSTSWSTARDYSATLGYVNFNQVANIFIYSLSGLVALLILKKDRKWIFISVFLVFGVLLTRNRIEILPLLCSIISSFIFKHDKLNIRTVIVAIVTCIVVIDIVYGIRVFRHYGTVQNFLNNFDLNDFHSKILLYLATDNGELGLRRDFYFFINGDNNFENFGKMHSYIRMMLVYLPTSWSFGLKPDDFAIAMGQAKGMVAGGSTHPTLFGDCYANLGIFGFLLGVFWAMYANIIDMIIVKRKRTFIKILLFVLNSVVYVIIGRGSVYNSFWFVAYGVPLLLFFEWFLDRFRLSIFKITFGNAKR